MVRWKLVLAWMAAVLVTTAVTWQIVSVADSQVSARPVEVVAVSSTSTTGPSTSSLDSTPTTVPTTTASTSTTTTSSTAATSTSTSTATADGEWSLRTITSGGGTVVIRHRPEEVELQAATPAPGFDVEIDDSGPQRVRIEFENDDSDIRVEAEWRNGELEVSVSGD